MKNKKHKFMRLQTGSRRETPGSIRIVMANMRLRHGSGSMEKVTALIPMEICMPILQRRMDIR